MLRGNKLHFMISTKFSTELFHLLQNMVIDEFIILVLGGGGGRVLNDFCDMWKYTMLYNS